MKSRDPDEKDREVTRTTGAVIRTSAGRRSITTPRRRRRMRSRQSYHDRRGGRDCRNSGWTHLLPSGSRFGVGPLLRDADPGRGKAVAGLLPDDADPIAHGQSRDVGLLAVLANASAVIQGPRLLEAVGAHDGQRLAVSSGDFATLNGDRLGRAVLRLDDELAVQSARRGGATLDAGDADRPPGFRSGCQR